MTSIRTTSNPAGTSSDPATIRQLSARGIAGVWAAAALPMGVLAWVFAPWFAGRLGGPSPFSRTRITALTIGLAWQFVLVLLPPDEEHHQDELPGKADRQRGDH